MACLKNKIMKKIYNYSMAILAIVSIVFVFLDLGSVISFNDTPFKQIDIIILAIFTVDYIARFIIAEKKSVFFKDNIFDLIAIIPFNSIFSIFRAFRLFRLAKLSKLSKMSRAVRSVGFLGVIKKKLSGILKTNGFLYVLYANIVLIIISAVVMMFAEKMTFGDALWWSIVTCTTVGYGDLSPVTTIGRVTAIVLMVFGIGLIGMLTGAITTYFTSNLDDKPAPEDNNSINSKIDLLSEDQKTMLIGYIDRLIEEKQKRP